MTDDKNKGNDTKAKRDTKTDAANADVTKPEATTAGATPEATKSETKPEAATSEAKPEAAPTKSDVKDGAPFARPASEMAPLTAPIEPDAPETRPTGEMTAVTGEAPPAPEPTAKDRRAASATIAMPLETAIGPPPAIPAAGSVEDPTFMPGAADVPAGSPADPGTAPGRVPPGDSRSLRRGNEFALVYRSGSAVISRFGVVGTRGQWRVVEYPTSSSASNGYAKECSRFVGEGFSDYRD